MDKRYVDIGVNLGNRCFDRDREAVIERALSAGVTAMILTGTDLAESEAMASGSSRCTRRTKRSTKPKTRSSTGQFVFPRSSSQ